MYRSHPWIQTLPRYRTSLFLLTISLALTACAGVKPAPYGDYSPDLRADGKPWQLRVDANSGQITLETALAKYDRSNVVLQQNKENRLATIVFSDADCSVGHEVSIWYQGLETGIGEHFYFDRPIPWGDPVNLAVLWHADGELIVRLNEEERRMKLVDSPRWFMVGSNFNSSDAVRIHYSAAQ